MDNEISDVTAVQTEAPQVETEVVAVEPVKPAEPTFTQKELEERISKVQSAAFKEAQAAKDAAKAAAVKAAELEAQTREMERRLAEAEAEKVRVWEESMSGIDGGQKVIMERRMAEEERKKAAEAQRQARQTYEAGLYGLKAARALALQKEHGVDWESLMGAGDEKDMENLALKMKLQALEAKMAPPPAPPKAPEPPKAEAEEPALHVDSGINTTRGGARLTPERLEDLYYENKISDDEYRRKRKELNY